MKQHIQLIIIGILITSLYFCQPKGNNPIGITFDEPENTQKIEPGQNWEELDNGVYVAWGNSNKRYHKDYIPTELNAKSYTCTGWKNERLNAQLVAWSKDTVVNFSLEISDLESDNCIIPSKAINHFYIRNVIGDSYLNGCGEKENLPETAILLPDCFEEALAVSLRSKSTRGIWFTIDIPEDANTGEYRAEVIVRSKGKKVEILELVVNVLDKTLPDPKDWKCHLDLWQNPFAVARINQVELWSVEHFELMKPLYTMLSNAGQKCITTSISHQPWGGQTYDPFQTMIKHIHKTDGSWEYEYSVFDNWVSFMMNLGINKQINCYSLIPWGNNLTYFDETLGRDTSITAIACSREFSFYWKPFLIDFKAHVKEKGWYDITTIAMDERPMEDMLCAIELIQEYSGLRITSAANYNPGISDKVYDLSVAFEHPLEPEIIQKRQDNKQLTTFYTYCFNKHPNNFTYSPPAEGVWEAWFAFSQNLDGFLRWAYNSWVSNPMQDTRFRKWQSGDTFLVYPGARSSIRFEKLREGIQDFEKLRILTQEWEYKNDEISKKKLKELENILTMFTCEKLEEEGAETTILRGKELINR